MKTSSSIAGAQPVMVYVPGPVERFGRRLKVEYLGMASVYSIIALLFFGDFSSWYKTILATLGAFFLFLGLKKKTEDHLVGSLVLFAARGGPRESMPCRRCSWVGLWQIHPGGWAWHSLPCTWLFPVPKNRTFGAISLTW